MIERKTSFLSSIPTLSVLSLTYLSNELIFGFSPLKNVLRGKIPFSRAESLRQNDFNDTKPG